MSTTVNKTTAVVGSTDFDEETWLVEPPNLPTQSNSTQESGRIAEWLQGAAMNVDFQTRSALSRKLASQAARKKKRAEKLREKTGSMNEHRRENMAQVKEELIEVNQSYGDNDNEKDTENEGIVPNSNDNSILVVDKKLSKQHSKISYEQQQHGVSGATVPPVLSLLPTGNMTIISDNIDDGGDDDDDDDENDEFYDASSDFNDLPFSSTAANTLIDNANISSAVASQNDSRDKVILNGSLLAAVSECIEPSADPIANSVDLLSSNGSHHEARQIRQVNTARVPPMIAQNVISQRSPLLDKSKSLCGSAKSHLPSTQPDLKDIKSIVERQEAELRQELSRLKSNVQDKSQMQSTRLEAASLASSRSIEFSANGAKLSAVAGPSPVFHASRLPTPIRRSLGRSLIPTPRASVLSRSAIRGLAGGSTPSLVLSSQHVYDDTRSECGGISHSEQQWADECF